jgi:hypothetical protein
MNNEITTGAFGANAKTQLNNNFEYIFQNVGSKLQRFYSKVNSSNVFKDETIRIVIWGDSLLNIYIATLKAFLNATYPEKTIEYKEVHQGGTGSNYHISMLWESINWNPDLIMCFEHEGFGIQGEIEETVFKLIKDKTSSDVVLIPWSITLSDMAYLHLPIQDIPAWKNSASYKIRQWFSAMASKYNFLMIDWNLTAIRDLMKGTITPSDLHADAVHYSNLFYSNYSHPVIQSHFSELHLGEHYNHHFGDYFRSIYFFEPLILPDVSDIEINGTWSDVAVNLDKTSVAAESSDSNAWMKAKINGIGFELAYFGHYTAQIGLFIVVDGVDTPLSTILKDYATSPNNSQVGPYKVIVDTNILSNNETQREFRITMTSATAYTLRDVTNSTDIRTGCLISQDEVFSVTGGQLTIPANYAKITNWRGTIANGQTYTFYVRKNWYDTIDVTATSLTHVIRVFGLERGEHIIKVKCNSGTISLDSIMELK